MAILYILCYTCYIIYITQMSSFGVVALLYLKLGGHFMLDKFIVKDLYLQGYNAVEISSKLKCDAECIRKCIQRNFKDFKDLHVEAKRIRKREEIRAVNKEGTRYISDRAFILKNRSIYKTLPNGDIVLDKEKAGTVTWDTPRRLVNEYGH